MGKGWKEVYSLLCTNVIPSIGVRLLVVFCFYIRRKLVAVVIFCFGCAFIFYELTGIIGREMLADKHITGSGEGYQNVVFGKDSINMFLAVIIELTDSDFGNGFEYGDGYFLSPGT